MKRSKDGKITAGLILIVISFIVLVWAADSYETTEKIIEEIEHDIEFTRYDPMGDENENSYTDVSMIFNWFSYRELNNRYISVYIFFDEDMEYGFLQLEKPMSTYSDRLDRLLDTGELIQPAERVYGKTSRMPSIDDWIETTLSRIETTLSGYDSESSTIFAERADELEEIYDFIDDNVVLHLQNNTTWTERITHTNTEYHLGKSIILVIVALLLFGSSLLMFKLYGKGIRKNE